MLMIVIAFIFELLHSNQKLIKIIINQHINILYLIMILVVANRRLEMAWYHTNMFNRFIDTCLDIYI